MKLSQLIDDLSSLLPLLGPGAPVLQHERLRISNDRDSVQVIDPHDPLVEDSKQNMVCIRSAVDDLGDALTEEFNDNVPTGLSLCLERVIDLVEEKA